MNTNDENKPPGGAESEMPPQEDIIIEPANADDFETVYGDYDANQTMSEVPGMSIRPYIRPNSILPNLTETEGGTIRLKCAIAAYPLPVSFEWSRNYAPIEKKKKKGKYKVKNTEYWSRLRISNLEVLDSGFYTCTATNSAGSVSQTSRVKINRDVNRNNRNRNQSGNDRGLNPQVPGSSNGRISASSSNDWLNNRNTPLQVGTCQPYLGNSCRQFLHGQHILITDSNPEVMLDIERHLQAAMMFITDSSDISESCKQHSHKVACYHMFHVCDPQGPADRDPPATLKMCQQDCERIQSSLCPGEYALAKKHELIGDGKLLPSCNELPKSSHNCIPVLQETLLTSQRVIDVNPLHFCYIGSGRSYRGTASHTESGHPCMEWSKAGKRYSPTPVETFDTKRAGNYCRNPDGSRPKPWCYASPNGPEEDCNIDACPQGLFPELKVQEISKVKPVDGRSKPPERGPAKTDTGTGQFLQDFWATLAPHWQYTIIGGTALLFLLLLMCCICCYCRLRGKKRRRGHNKSSVNGSLLSNGNSRKPNGSTQAYHVNPEVSGFEMSALLPPPPARSPPPAFSDLPPEIPPNQIRFLEVLGEGQFGKVWKGELIGYNGANEEAVQVAIKTLRDEALPRQKLDFQQEASIMGGFRHQNVVELIGNCTNTSPQCMIFEYMIHGDLHEFLMLRSPYAQLPTGAVLDRERLMIDHGDFLHIATQIAAGMEYLSSCHYVHRDLATRNCLVTDRLTIKISDFGVMRDIYVADYYNMHGKTMLPIRWMPPEAILFGKFSEESDVWAYGVVVWEIYSYGTQPFYGYSNSEVIELIRTRCLLESPDNCPSRIYSLMVECWHEVSVRRPKFSEIYGRLKTWSVMSSPAQSSAVSAAGPHYPHQGQAPPRSGSMHSGTSGGRVSRQSSSTHHSGGPNGSHPLSLPPGAKHGSPYTGAVLTQYSLQQKQTMVTMNGVVPLQVQNGGSPALSHNRANGRTNHFNGSNQKLTNGHNHANSFDLDSSTSGAS